MAKTPSFRSATLRFPKLKSTSPRIGSCLLAAQASSLICWYWLMICALKYFQYCFLIIYTAGTFFHKFSCVQDLENRFHRIRFPLTAWRIQHFYAGRLPWRQTLRHPGRRFVRTGECEYPSLLCQPSAALQRGIFLQRLRDL